MVSEKEAMTSKSWEQKRLPVTVESFSGSRIYPVIFLCVWAMRGFLQNKGKVRGYPVGVEDSLILMDKKYNKNLPLVSMNQRELSEVLKKWGERAVKVREIYEGEKYTR